MAAALQGPRSSSLCQLRGQPSLFVKQAQNADFLKVAALLEELNLLAEGIISDEEILAIL